MRETPPPPPGGGGRCYKKEGTKNRDTPPPLESVGGLVANLLPTDFQKWIGSYPLNQFRGSEPDILFQS